MSIARRLTPPLLAAMLVAAPALAGTTVGDWLNCWKAKDSLKKASFTGDVQSVNPDFPSKTGCVIKLPAKYLCHGATPTNVQPGPGFFTGGIPILGQIFACYPLKCPKGEVTLNVNDHFGNRPMTAKAPAYLCGPANILPPCGSSAPACNGSCPAPAHCAQLIDGTCACGVG